MEAEAAPDLLDLDEGQPAVVQEDDRQGQAEATGPATSPHVIWKQPSPTSATTGHSGRASFAAMAAGSPKPIDQKRARRVRRPLRGDLMGVSTHVEGQDAVAGQRAANNVDGMMGGETGQRGPKQALKPIAVPCGHVRRPLRLRRRKPCQRDLQGVAVARPGRPRAAQGRQGHLTRQSIASRSVSTRSRRASLGSVGTAAISWAAKAMPTATRGFFARSVAIVMS